MCIVLKIDFFYEIILFFDIQNMGARYQNDSTLIYLPIFL